MKEPKVDLPTCLFGFVRGILRFERLGGGDLLHTQLNPDDFSDWGSILYEPPFVYNGSDYAITHLQKYSKFGFLLMWPFCFHVWFTFKFQKKDSSGLWIPGSEKVFYWRFGLWRWDAGNSRFIGPGTWYGPGLHWD